MITKGVMVVLLVVLLIMVVRDIIGMVKKYQQFKRREQLEYRLRFLCGGKYETVRG